LGILTSQVYEEKEVQVDDETVGKSLQSIRKVNEEKEVQVDDEFF
jgi:hypothetical protein